MITKIIIALFMFFNVSFGQTDDVPGKTPPKGETPTKTIIITDITP